MNEDGVGPVVAAVLLLGLLTVVSSIWTFATLPDWITEREDEHREDAATKLLGLRDDLEAAAIRGSRIPATTSLDLAPSAIPLLQPVSARGTLSLHPPTGIATSFEDATLLAGAGRLLGPATAPVPDQYDDVERLEGLLVTLTSSGTSAGRAGWVLVEATDGDSTVRINVTHQNGVSCQDREVHLRVEVVGEPPRYDQAISCGVGTDLDAFEVDLLDPRYHVTGALAVLAAPFDLSLAGGGKAFDEARHAIWWTDADSEQVIGSGSGSTDLIVDRQGRALVYDLRGQGLYEQALVLDAGGLLAVQPDGAVVTASPGFSISGTVASPRLDWTFVVPDGAGEREGAGPAAVTASFADLIDALFTADEGGITLTTPHAAAWAARIDEHLQYGGLGSLAAVTLDGDEVDFDIIGGTWTIHLRIITADVEVT